MKSMWHKTERVVAALVEQKREDTSWQKRIESFQAKIYLVLIAQLKHKPMNEPNV